MHEVEGAVAKAVYRWAAPGGPGGFNAQTCPSWADRQALIADIVSELAKLPEGHEVRVLRRKVKDLGRQMGKQAQRIYDLRCQLAEARSLVNIDRSGYRSMRDRLNEALKENKQFREQVKNNQYTTIGGLA